MRHSSVDVVLAEGRPTRVALVSDTHGLPHPQTVSIVTGLAPDVVLHAGDVGGYQVLDLLAPLSPQLIAVRGNIDGNAFDLPDVITVRWRRAGAVVMRWLLLHIGVQGARLLPAVRTLAAAEDADLVVCGHSHMPLIARDRTAAIFNPGSVGPRRFGLPIVLGTATVASTGLTLGHMDCETGAAWRP